MYFWKRKNTKKNIENQIFLLFFVTLPHKIAFIMKKLWVFAALTCAFSACQESLEERCAREVKDYTNKNCPAKMGDNIILDSLTFELPTHTLHYYYRLTGEADREGIMEEIGAKDMLRQELKNTTAMKTYKDNGYNFTYTYRSEKDPKKVLMEVTFTEKDY